VWRDLQKKHNCVNQIEMVTMAVNQVHADTSQGYLRSFVVKVIFFPVCSFNEEAVDYDSE
jgi:hypothetical protein